MTRVRIYPSDRPTGLGASELAAIGGLSPWRTPLDVWLSKIEPPTADDPTPAQAWGQALEGFLVHHVGGKRNSVTKSHPDWPVVRLFATPDGQADGGRTLIEAKSVGSRFSDWDGGVPDYYRVQALGQLACYPQADRVLFSVALGGRHETREVLRDPDEIDELVEAAMRWWADYVVRETVPPPVNDADRWTIARRTSGNGDRMTRLAVPDEEAAAADLLALRDRIADLEADAEATRLRLAELASVADIAGTGWKAAWSTRVSRDYKAAWAYDKGTAVVPDLFVTEGRVFSVRRTKESEA